MNLLIYCGHMINCISYSGVQRVIIEVSRALTEHCNIYMVKWDKIDGQLRYCNEEEIKNVFKDNSMSGTSHPYCSRTAYRFGDTLEQDNTYLLFPEIPYHLEEGNDIFAKIISQCREYKIIISAIFYDLIPIIDKNYRIYKENHTIYIANLLRCDRIFTITKFIRSDLIRYLESTQYLSKDQLKRINNKIIHINLGEYRIDEESFFIEENDIEEPVEPLVMMVGTIEPRKQQTKFLQIFNKLCRKYPELKKITFEIFGSLHPACSEDFHKEIKKNPKIIYHEYASDEEIDKSYAKAWFTVFPSANEGFGLPIVESIKHGVPCLTSNFGAMQEVAVGGGCKTVNFLKDSEIEKGFIEIFTNSNYRKKLRKEIRSRPNRSWNDYTLELMKSLEDCKNEIYLNDMNPINIDWDYLYLIYTDYFEGNNIYLKISLTDDKACYKISKFMKKNSINNANNVCILKISDKVLLADMEEAFFIKFVNADCIIFETKKSLDYFIEILNNKKINIPITKHILYKNDSLKDVYERINLLIHSKKRIFNISETEKNYNVFYKNMCSSLPKEKSRFSIVISTYNRAEFVEMNVNHILKLIQKEKLDVNCIVVDNSSTDNTYEKLTKFIGNSNFKYICNPANTGMLGNLRMCSIINESEYVWVIGDDDYITKGTITNTLKAIEKNQGIPFLFHNFGVYHREFVVKGDLPEKFIREVTPISNNPSPEGVYSIAKIATEHDNFFTAIYQIVFRSDILAACFNYPFDGVPFNDLVESIPTTKFILETYSYSNAYWFKTIGIVANAHNSWSSYRPRWHLVLMPEVFDLARDIGVDREKLWSYIPCHYSLFEEAIKIAVEKKLKVNLNLLHDLDNAHRVFRKKVKLTKNLKDSVL